MVAVTSDPFDLAKSGINYAQKASAVAIRNMNASADPNATRQRIEAITIVANGVGLGIEASPVMRDVDKNQVDDLRLKHTSNAVFEKDNEMYMMIDQRLGQPGDGQDLGSDFTRIKAAITIAINAADQPWAQSDIVKYVTQTTKKLNDLSQFVQQQRTFADQSIDTAVKEINSRITNIQELARQSVISSQSGGSAPDYEDKIDAAVRDLSDLMNIQVYRDDKGTIRITTASGNPLLVGADIYPLSYQPAVGISPLTDPTILPQISINGINIHKDISGGRLRSLIDWRDTKITNQYQAPLDELATQFRDALNKIHNRGVGHPPRQNITGERAFATPGVSTIQTTGLVRIALVDRTTGQFVGGINPLDLDLTAGPVTVNAMVTQLNTHFSTGGFGAATLNAGGQLNLAATNANHGFAIVSLGATPGTVMYDDAGGAPVDTGVEFSHFLGLNNLITSGTRQIADGNASKANISELVDVRADIQSNPALLSRTTLYSDVLPTNGRAITAGGNDLLIGLKDVLDTKITFAGAGYISAGLVETLADYANTFYHQHASSALFTSRAYESSKLILDQTTQEFAAATAVNTTEEMTKIIELQFFNAICLKCLEIARSMREELLHSIKV